METIIETERLLIREILPTDESGMFELDSDPLVHRFVGRKPVSEIEESRQVIQRIRGQYVDYGIGRWAMVEKGTNAFIGWTGFKYITEEINDHSGYHDLGYRLCRRFWGKGYATESAKACRDHAFEKLGLQKIYAMAHVENAESLHVLEKTGLKVTGSFVYDGQPKAWLELDKNEWKQLVKKP
jgi:ribosomal-protein-alanine N-acetyltransferase